LSEPHVESPQEADDANARPVDEAAPTGPVQGGSVQGGPVQGGSTARVQNDVLLEVDHVTLRFGGVVALNDVSFSLRKGEIFGLIGPNGAGKTTCFNAMTGVYRPTTGDIRFLGESIVGKKKHEITRGGIARTFQNVRLFPEMTALENVMVGADAHHKTSVVGALFRLPRHWAEERSGRDRSMQLLRFVGIERRAGEVSRNLSYGEQRRLEIARALATNPTLLCLDEPAAGFNPAEKEDLLALIRKIRDTGVTVLLIEHDMRLVMGVTDRIVVLEFGKKIAEGSPAEVRDNPAVIAAYLGVPTDAA
jgi:branched-chain amino acid transport system ATP-binding protein